MKTFKFKSNWWKWQRSGGWLLIAIICVIVAELWGSHHVWSVGAAVRQGRRWDSGLPAGLTAVCELWSHNLRADVPSGEKKGWRRSLFTCAWVWEQLLQNDLKIAYNRLQMCFFLHKFCSAWTEFTLLRQTRFTLPLAPACCSGVLHKEDRLRDICLAARLRCTTAQPLGWV